MTKTLDINRRRMVRGKVEMKRIENPTSRQITFSKRRRGLLKKAYELSVLCDAEVALIIISQKGKLFEFSSNNLQKTIERYRKIPKDVPNGGIELEQNLQQLKLESASMVSKIEVLEAAQRKLLGRDLHSCSKKELESIESQLERSLRIIRARKDQLFEEHVVELKSKERSLLRENARLSKECGVVLPWGQPDQQEKVATHLGLSLNGKSSEVETDLSIGLPEMRHCN